MQAFSILGLMEGAFESVQCITGKVSNRREALQCHLSFILSVQFQILNIHEGVKTRQRGIRRYTASPPSDGPFPFSARVGLRGACSLNFVTASVKAFEPQIQDPTSFAKDAR